MPAAIWATAMAVMSLNHIKQKFSTWGKPSYFPFDETVNRRIG